MTEHEKLFNDAIAENIPITQVLQELVIGYIGCHECDIAQDRLIALCARSDIHIYVESEYEYTGHLDICCVKGNIVSFDYNTDTGTCDMCGDIFEQSLTCDIYEFAYAIAHRRDFSTLFTKGYAFGLGGLGDGKHETHPINNYPTADDACGYALRATLGYDKNCK